MKSYEEMQYFDKQEKLVSIICQKTQNANPHFFRNMVAYYFAKVASMMRANIATQDRGVIPVNLYVINLATSGQGKGYSTNIIEEQVIASFKDRFLHETFPVVSEKNLQKLGVAKAIKKNIDEDTAHEMVHKEFENLGELAFSFDSATVPAVKQMRHKLLMANAGSMNMEIDEIGSNLVGNLDVLTTFLELYDMGKVKQKLVKNTAESVRNSEIDGKTPTNMLLFGTPSKLLAGDKTEAEFISMLETGYARRCIFGYQPNNYKINKFTAEEVFNMMTDTTSATYLQQLSQELYILADALHFNREIQIDKDMTLLLIEYQMQCEDRANALPEHQEIQKAELTHRYFKVLKLAGVYAYIDNCIDITEDHLYAAIKLVEDSGRAFQEMLTRERNYVKLAKYIAAVDKEVTHVDLMEDLPLYKGGEAHRKELINLATVWGYKNNIIIKKSVVDGIEFMRGESLKEVNLDEINISYGTKLAEDYFNDTAKFDEIHNLTQLDGYHFTNHKLIDGYRKEENCIPGCDMIILDIDGTTTIETATNLFKDYKFHLYTTKSHKPDSHRFRMIFPLSHRVKLEAVDYKQFMDNIYDWLPFEVDRQTNQRSRKWASHKGDYLNNNGIPLDAFMFIPKTTKCDETKKTIIDLGNLTNLERWFIKETANGNRSNNLVRYALMLVDTGMEFDTIKNNVLILNSKLNDPLEETEILGTIMITVSKAIIAKATNKP
jgi:hypothetical protein